MSCVLKMPNSRGAAPLGDVYLLDPHKRSDTGHMSLLDEAIAEAKEIVRSAREEADGIRREALARGYEEGLNAARQQYCTSIDDFEKVSHAIHEERDSFFAQLEPQVIKLCIEIAEKILRRELDTKPESVLDNVKFALLQLADRDSIKLRVNPDDAEMIKEHRDSVRDSADGIRQIEIIEDRRVDRGGCIAESSGSSLDARIKSQMSVIARTLTEATGDNTGGAEPGPEQIFESS